MDKVYRYKEDDYLYLGDNITYTGTDHKFKGVIVSIFPKLNKDEIRIVVENSDGVLHIQSPWRGITKD